MAVQLEFRFVSLLNFGVLEIGKQKNKPTTKTETGNFTLFVIILPYVVFYI